ncbi:hypothetical protein F5J12DRAFT_778731 [Pisolithus orientalis]|uniref:uncharacterized protein n=1 Tax=Pisolithus orientalis TaxID=936130 RepID=UPI002223EFE2|nr:uncharacterized protein F5J12DRAFT_778731 [Pisolithus orientalis]KAI6035230.1 hypothetical protein F5J12DRAFT_778731 [Pisolithus orientalis]
MFGLLVEGVDCCTTPIRSALPVLTHSSNLEESTSDQHMETQASRSTPNNPTPAVQGSPRTRDLRNLRTKEPGSAFRGIGRERGGRGNRGGRGGGRQQSNFTGRIRAENPSDFLSQPDTVSSKTEPSSKSLASSSIPSVDKLPERAVDGVPERVAGKAQSGRSSQRSSRRRATAHEAEVRHDIEALVERVRAVAMAENRPTTPGSHIDWAGDEDDSLPDLDDWGVTTTAYHG